MSGDPSREFDFAFVAENGSEGPSKADRRLIRSRCMRGRNQKKQKKTADTRARTEAALRSLVSQTYPSTLEAMQFAAELPVQGKIHVLNFLRFLDSTTSPYTQFFGYGLSQTHMGRLVFLDPVYLQSSIFSAFAMRDTAQRRPISAVTIYHLQKTIASLNKTLSMSDRRTAIQDSTLAVVTVLAFMACMTNDTVGARAHVNGLQQMMKIRAVISTVPPSLLGVDPQDTVSHYRVPLHTYDGVNPLEIVQYCSVIDLVYALSTGALMCQLATSPEAYNPRFHDMPSQLIPRHCIDPGIFALHADPRVLDVFRKMQCFTEVLNGASTSKQYVRGIEFHSAFCSVQNPLLSMQGEFEVNDERDCGLSECLRLAMLSVLGSSMELPWPRPWHPYLTDRFRACCQNIAVIGHAPLSRDLLRWLLILCAVSVFDAQSASEQWLWERWRKDVDQLDWDETKVRLRRMIWVDGWQDRAGRDAFNRLNNEPPRA